MSLTGKARVAGVMGWPVGHSRSPALHGHWLARYRIDGTYVPMPVEPAGLAQALKALPVLGFRGANLTIPHKEAALAHVDRVEEGARRIGAINTVVVEDGRLLGSNSDGYGFMSHLCQAAPAWRAPGTAAAVLGAGGAARSALAMLLDAGVERVFLLNRTEDRAAVLAKLFGTKVTVRPWAERAGCLADVALLVNTTSLGMAGQPALDLALDRLPTGAVVYDIVYVPLETPLLRAARARGLHAVDGLGMLLHQARPGFKAWFGVDPEVTPDLHAAIAATIPS